MKKTSSQYMKKLRENRRENKQCIRCGKHLDEDDLKNDYKQCDSCRDYVLRHNRGEISSKENTTYFYNRTWKKDEIKKPQLADFIIKNKLSISDLALATGLSTRTINRLLYHDLPYSDKTKKIINDYTGQEIL